MKELIIDLTTREEGEDNPEIVDFENILLDNMGKKIRVRVTIYRKPRRPIQAKGRSK